MKNYWHNLQDRERITLLAGSAATVLLLIYMLVWEPLDTARSRLRAGLADQIELLAWMKSAAAEVARRKGTVAAATTGGSGQSLLSRVEGAARRSGLAKSIKRIQPDGASSVQVWLDTVAFDEALLWIGKIVDEERLVTQDLAIDKSEGVGLVNLRIVIKDKAP